MRCRPHGFPRRTEHEAVPTPCGSRSCTASEWSIDASFLRGDDESLLFQARTTSRQPETPSGGCCQGSPPLGWARLPGQARPPRRQDVCALTWTPAAPSPARFCSRVGCRFPTTCTSPALVSGIDFTRLFHAQREEVGRETV